MVGKHYRFLDRIGKVPRTAMLEQEDWYVWGATMAKTPDGLCHLLFSRWPKVKGFNAWVTHSEIAHAVADHPLGPYVVQGTVFKGRGGTAWDAAVVHNPQMIYHAGRYYLYYMGTRGPGGFWDYRNRQRIGVAVADHPAGPWERLPEPIINVTPGAWDSLMMSNPACCYFKGKFYLLYKGVNHSPTPQEGSVRYGVAISDSPTGPFVKHPAPVIENPTTGWSVEDAYVWAEGEYLYCLVKDFQGYFTKAERNTLALFYSTDGLKWEPCEQPLALRREIIWEDGTRQEVHRLERPQLWLENGKPAVLFCACLPEQEANTSFNLHIPLTDVGK